MIGLLTLPLSICPVSTAKKHSKLTKSKVKETKKVKLLSEWELTIQAITAVESNNDDTALSSSSSAAGRFQQLECYVEDCNRILGKKKYSLADRHNPVKAREMFDIIQAHYNPERDCRKAILLHRGKNSKAYLKAVLFKLYELKAKNIKEYNSCK